MLADTPIMEQTAPPIQENETVHRTTMTWTVTFQHTFEVVKPLTREDFVELTKTHLAEMQKQFPELLKQYPQEFLKEMHKSHLLDVTTFQPNGNGKEA